MYAGATQKRWFADEFGFQELGPKNVVLDAPDEFFAVLPDRMLKSLANGQQWTIGTFSTPTLRELRRKDEEMKSGPAAELRRKDKEMKSGPAAEQEHRGLRFSAIEADVVDLHQDVSNLHATFQVASQFNCLEMPSDSYTPAAGITGYVKDRTQGPACALCTAPALLYRNYWHGQLDNLDEMSSALQDGEGRFWTMRNGYTLSNPQQLDRLRHAIEGTADRELLLGQLKVGVHSDIAVTRKDAQGRIEESMLVSHVLGSACAVAYNPGTRAEEWEPFARLVLDASYESCVLAALQNRDRHNGMAGSKKLFLTLLGGDAFGNPQAWILDAIRRALRKFEHQELDVFLVCYDGVGAGPRRLEEELAAGGRAGA